MDRDEGVLVDASGVPIATQTSQENIRHIVARLQEDPQYRLPSRYREPEEGSSVELWRPAMDTDIQDPDTDTVPTIDLRELEFGDPNEIETLAMELGSACEEWGCCQILNHGIADEVIESHRQVGLQFMELPLELKEKAVDPDGRCLYDGRFQGLISGVPWLEYLTGDHKPVSNVGFIRRKIWQRGDALGDSFENSISEYCIAMERLAVKLLRLLAINVKLPVNFFSSDFEGSAPFDSSWRFNHYPPCPPGEVIFGEIPYSYASVLELTQQDEVGGMQVCSGYLSYNINPIPGAIIVAVGDCLEALSNGAYRSAVHQVLLTDKNVWRFSMVYSLNLFNKDYNFFSPSFEVDPSIPPGLGRLSLSDSESTGDADRTDLHPQV